MCVYIYINICHLFNAYTLGLISTIFRHTQMDPCVKSTLPAGIYHITLIFHEKSKYISLVWLVKAPRNPIKIPLSYHIIGTSQFPTFAPPGTTNSCHPQERRCAGCQVASGGGWGDIILCLPGFKQNHVKLI